jgi:hypothetical protein
MYSTNQLARFAGQELLTCFRRAQALDNETYFSGGFVRSLHFLTVIATLTLCSAVKADVVVISSLSLSQLQIVPTSGTLQILSPFSASANAQAQDDISGMNSQFNQVNDSATSAAAATAFAIASGAASSVSLTASAASGVNIPEITSFASSTGQSGLGVDFGGTGQFEIVSPSNTTVTTSFNAGFTGAQSLTTTGGGQFATSEIIFNLMLPDLGSNSSVLFYDNPLSIGPNGMLMGSFSNTLMSSVDLQTNTPYSLLLEVDAESSGYNFVPEPSYSFLTGCSFFVILLAGGVWRAKLARKSVSA